MTQILNFGSLNLDHVYTMPTIVRPGQTLPSTRYEIFAGGKGANQSVALARAGARVRHAGRVGEDGRQMVDALSQMGVDTRWIVVDSDLPTGHAIIQVEETGGENAILLFPGANHAIDDEQISTTLREAEQGTILLLQNEISRRISLLSEAKDRGLFVVFNPAPFTPDIAATDLECVDLLIVNETEAASICGASAKLDRHQANAHNHAGADPEQVPEKTLARLKEHVPQQTQRLLTLGAKGAIFEAPGQPSIRIPAEDAGEVVDTTAAGDTFVGFYLAEVARSGITHSGIRRSETDEQALRMASAAAALCVTSVGAQHSIPTRPRVEEFMSTRDA